MAQVAARAAAPHVVATKFCAHFVQHHRSKRFVKQVDCFMPGHAQLCTSLSRLVCTVFALTKRISSTVFLMSCAIVFGGNGCRFQSRKRD